MPLFIAGNKIQSGAFLPVYKGSSSDDLFRFNTPQIRLYDNASPKNTPPFKSGNFFTAIYLINDASQIGPEFLNGQNTTGELICIGAKKNEIFIAGRNGNFTDAWNPGWVSVATSNDIKLLQDQINNLKK